MITKEELVQWITAREWYQTIKFEDDVISKGCGWCGEMAWEHIAPLLPKSLENKRILDLGCNAGLFCLKTAVMGAKEVIGVDWPGWRPKHNFQEQQAFVKAYFDQKYNRNFPVRFITGKMEEVLQTEDLGEIDYTLAIASIYYTSTPVETVEAISKISKNVIVRLRDENRIQLFTTLFKQYGYKEVTKIQEKCWEELNIPTDNFYLYLYSK